jgi:DNA topoisomerase VI subunit B
VITIGQRVDRIEAILSAIAAIIVREPPSSGISFMTDEQVNKLRTLNDVEFAAAIFEIDRCGWPDVRKRLDNGERFQP